MARPNILFYCTDQQRFDTIGALGNPYVQTPRLDQLVQEGTAFTHAYCQSPICTPSRSSFMTGLYPSRVHNTRNGNDTWPADAPPLISKLLADSGYVCGNVGKFHLTSSGLRTEPRLDDGYSYWKFSHAPRDDWKEGHDYADWVREKGGDLDALRASPDNVPPEFHQTTWATDRSIEFISRNEDQPWFLTVNIYDPHPPFVPPKEYADRFDPKDMPGAHHKESDRVMHEKLKGADFQKASKVYRSPAEFDGKKEQALYYAMIAQIDDQFARLLQALDDSDQRNNTLIVFSSDHGEALGDHGLILKGCRFYEGLVRVPLIFSWPGVVQQNVQVGGLVELLDMSATILDFAGLEIPEYFQGNSLRSHLEGKASGEQIRDSVRCEYFDAVDAHFTDGNGTFATMYRRGQYKLCVYHGLKLGELYDLASDPWEHNNLWDSPEHQSLKHELIYESFDNHVLSTTDVGSRRIAPM
ncbi:MAG: sulfatase-like hydrolase/transferase [Verrucomicrobia bacterium]|nr:sulfatase-like hydrolase/transferase [Verrucomicrobiota bacterium]